MNDLISRQAAIDAVVGCTNCGTEDELRAYVTKYYLDNGWTDGIVDALDAIEQLSPAQPEQDILAWLLAYHTKSFDLNGRYMAHEVIGWLVHDFATAYMAEGREE